MYLLPLHSSMSHLKPSNHLPLFKDEFDEPHFFGPMSFFHFGRSYFENFDGYLNANGYLLWVKGRKEEGSF